MTLQDKSPGRFLVILTFFDNFNFETRFNSLHSIQIKRR